MSIHLCNHMGQIKKSPILEMIQIHFLSNDQFQLLNNNQPITIYKVENSLLITQKLFLWIRNKNYYYFFRLFLIFR